MWKHLLLATLMTVAMSACVVQDGETSSGQPDIGITQVPVGGSGATGAGNTGPTQ